MKVFCRPNEEHMERVTWCSISRRIINLWEKLPQKINSKITPFCSLCNRHFYRTLPFVHLPQVGQTDFFVGFNNIIVIIISLIILKLGPSNMEHRCVKVGSFYLFLALHGMRLGWGLQIPMADWMSFYVCKHMGRDANLLPSPNDEHTTCSAPDKVLICYIIENQCDRALTFNNIFCVLEMITQNDFISFLVLKVALKLLCLIFSFNWAAFGRFCHESDVLEQKDQHIRALEAGVAVLAIVEPSPKFTKREHLEDL